MLPCALQPCPACCATAIPAPAPLPPFPFSHHFPTIPPHFSPFFPIFPHFSPFFPIFPPFFQLSPFFHAFFPAGDSGIGRRRSLVPASVASWAMPTDRLLLATCLYSVHPVPWPPPFPTFDYCPISYRDMWSAAPRVLPGCQVDAAVGGPAALGGRRFAPPGVEGAQPVHHDTSIQAIHQCFRRGQGCDDRRDRLDDRFRDAAHDLRLIQ